MTESTRELFNNFKGTLNDYTANAFGIGMYMTAPKTLDDETKEEYKNIIRKGIKDELELEKELDDYAVALTEDYHKSPNFIFYQSIKNAIESLRKNSYDAGKAYYRNDTKEKYERLQSVFMEDHDALIKMMEEELENA